MTKKKLDLLRTKKNLRITPYGDYYIEYKDVDSDFTLSPLEIELIFETSQGKQTRYICHFNFGMIFSLVEYCREKNIQRFITIYFPSHTTLSILQYRNLVELLAADKDIDKIITNRFSEVNSIRGHPSNPLLSKTLLERHVIDVELDIKLKSDYPIVFEDIEEARNMEMREQALRKFGYENYIREGFKRNKIDRVTVDKNVVVLDNITYCYIGVQDKIPPLTKRFNPRYNKDEKLIFMENDIAFLQVKDSSTNKTYFLKVPPTMCSVEEAKAWTFGLTPGEYSPAIET